MTLASWFRVGQEGSLEERKTKYINTFQGLVWDVIKGVELESKVRVGTLLAGVRGGKNISDSDSFNY